MKKRIVMIVLVAVVVIGGGVAAFLLLKGGVGMKPPTGISTQSTAPAGVTPDGPAKAQELVAAEQRGASPPTYYKYASSDRRDPFLPLVTPKDGDGKLKGATPLESYEVSEFKLIGVVWSTKGYVAQVVVPDGKSYSLREGARLGPHGGRVVKITKDTVTIRENVRDYRGILKPKDTLLKLRLEEQG